MKKQVLNRIVDNIYQASLQLTELQKKMRAINKMLAQENFGSYPLRFRLAQDRRMLEVIGEEMTDIGMELENYRDGKECE